MNCAVSETEQAIVIEGEMTIYAAAEVKQQLLQRLIHSRNPVALDLAQISEIDTTGVQLVLMVRRLCTASARTFLLSNPSAAVQEALTLCGLQEIIKRSEHAS